jgi:hypothetical protein
MYIDTAPHGHSSAPSGKLIGLQHQGTFSSAVPGELIVL